MEKIYYGITTYVDTVNIEEFKGVNFDNLNHDRFSHIIDYDITFDDWGNGSINIRVYTFGKLEKFTSGNFKISPTIRCYFNWSFMWAKVEVTDIYGYIFTHKSQIYYSWNSVVANAHGMIGGLFKMIFSLKKFTSKEHYELEQKLK